jgi:hypothetical protein
MLIYDFRFTIADFIGGVFGSGNRKSQIKNRKWPGPRASATTGRVS